MRRRPWLVAGGVVGLVVLVLVAGQLLLPALAARSVRGDLQDDGAQVRDVQVSAFPAWRVLGDHADRLGVSLRSARGTAGAPGALDGLLERVAHVDRVDLDIDRFALDLAGTPLGTVTLGPVRVRIRGARLQAHVTAPLRGLTGALLPELASRLQATGGRLVLSAGGGALGLLDVALVDAVHLQVERVSSRREGDALTVTVDGRRS